MVFVGRSPLPDSARRALTLLGIVAADHPVIAPFSASVEVSSKCNFHCLMCPYHSPLIDKPVQARTDYMELSLAERVFKEVARLGARVVNFGHRGEPTLHPEFPDIVRLASKEGLQTRVFTNGSLLTERKIKDLIDAGLTTLAVSLVGASPESYQAIHPAESPEAYWRVLDSVALLQSLKKRKGSTTPILDLRFIASARGCEEVDKMIDLGIELEAEAINLFPFRYRSDGDIGALAPDWDMERMAVARFKELAPRAARAGIKTNPDEMAAYHLFGPVSLDFPCYAAWVETNIEVDGNVTFCVRSRTSVGNVADRPLKEIWLSSEYNRLRRLAMHPAERPKVGQCDCDRCCLFYTSWRITSRLAAFGLAPRIEPAKGERSSAAPNRLPGPLQATAVYQLNAERNEVGSNGSIRPGAGLGKH